MNTMEEIVNFCNEHLYSLDVAYSPGSEEFEVKITDFSLPPFHFYAKRTHSLEFAWKRIQEEHALHLEDLQLRFKEEKQ